MPVHHSLKNRNIYLDRLITLQDTPVVKVITGIRRAGKTSLIKLMIRHLLATGVSESQILEMDFESFEFSKMSAEYFFHYVRNRVSRGKRTYLFFDELQAIPEWAEQVSAFLVAFDCDIYITASNATLLSAEYRTYLAGKSVEIRLFPLTFAEFPAYHGYTIFEKEDEGGTLTRSVIDADGKPCGMSDMFDAYLRYGGMPVLSEAPLEEEKFKPFLDGVYSTVILRDILERERRLGQQLIKDPALLKKIILYLAENVGCHISVSAIGDALVSGGLLFEGTRENAPSAHTVQAYVNALTEAYLFCDVRRFDIRTGEYLRTLGKFYMADVGLRSYLLGFDTYNSEHALENVVCIELLSRGYEVAVGKIGTAEVDFIATKANEKLYIQVARSMADEALRKQELAPLRKIRDNYAKMVLSLEPGETPEYDGILSVELTAWLMERAG